MTPIYHTNQTQHKFDKAFKELNFKESSILFIVGPTGGGKTFLINTFGRKYQYTLLRVEVKESHKRLPLKEIEDSTQTELQSGISETLSLKSEIKISEKNKSKTKEHTNTKTQKRLKLFESTEKDITLFPETPFSDDISTDFDDIPLHLNQPHTLNPVDIFETDDYSELKTFLFERKQKSLAINKLIIETRNPNLKKLVQSYFPSAITLSVPRMTKLRMKKYNILDANLHTSKFHRTFLKSFCLKKQVDTDHEGELEDGVSIYGSDIVDFNRHLARLFNGRPTFKHLHFSNFLKIFEYIYENYVSAVISSRDNSQSLESEKGNLNTCRNIIEMLSKSAYYESFIHKIDKNSNTYFSDTYGLSISYFHSIMSKRKGNRKYVSPNDYFKLFTRK